MPPVARRVAILTFDERVDRRILREAESLVAAGYEVVGLAVPRHGAETDPDPPWLQRVPKAEAVRGAKGSVVYGLWVRFGRPLAMRFPSVRRIATAVRRGMTRGGVFDPTGYFDALLHPAAAQIQADVYIAHDLPLLPTAVKCARAHHAVAVYDSHELWPEQEFEPPVRDKWAALEREWIGSADSIIAVNASIADEMKQRYGVAEVTVVHNSEHPIPRPAERPRRFHDAFGLPREARVALFQGGFSATRNLDVLVRAFGLIRDPSIHLVMLGWGEAERQLVELARQLGLESRVHFHPKVLQDELLQYTQSADLGVIPYQPVCLNSHYCTPNKLFEFIAAGLPMIASDLPELRRFVVGLDVGLVGDTSTPESFARLVESYFADPSLAARFERNMPAAQTRACWAVDSVAFVGAVERALARTPARVDPVPEESKP